jgi:branched-chain amino acid transport system substrate-binding protein
MPAMAEALRVGVLNDLSSTSPGPADIVHWLNLACDELSDTGRIDRPVEWIVASGMGLPLGTAAAVERAFTSLVDQDVLLIVGPAIGDNALVATPLAEHFRVPTLNWAGSERARGDYMFHLQVGSHEDESLLLARHCAAQGATRLGVVYDRSPIGRRHFAFLQSEAEILGVRIVAAIPVMPLAEDVPPDFHSAVGSIDALVYLGLGISAPAVARAARASGYDGLRAMNTAGLRGYAPEFARLIDGWVYVDMFADDNRTLRSLLERRQLSAAKSTAAAKGYDLGRLVAEALARAPERTRDGTREGLEAIKWLPAAEGHEGTLLGFGRYDRGALHGRYLVLRQWRDGRSIQVA